MEYIDRRISTSSMQNTTFLLLKKTEIEVFSKENSLLYMAHGFGFYINWCDLVKNCLVCTVSTGGTSRDTVHPGIRYIPGF